MRNLQQHKTAQEYSSLQESGEGERSSQTTSGNSKRSSGTSLLSASRGSSLAGSASRSLGTSLARCSRRNGLRCRSLSLGNGCEGGAIARLLPVPTGSVHSLSHYRLRGAKPMPRADSLISGEAVLGHLILDRRPLVRIGAVVVAGVEVGVFLAEAVPVIGCAGFDSVLVLDLAGLEDILSVAGGLGGNKGRGGKKGDGSETHCGDLDGNELNSCQMELKRVAAVKKGSENPIKKVYK